MPSTDEEIARASKALIAGELVAFPTETVYGLGANARDDKAIEKIYQSKGRPSNNPLIVHIHDRADILHDVQWNAQAEALAKAFWPGPLTLILKRTADCTLSSLVSAGGDTVGIRMPAHPLASTLLRRCNLPLAAPSANPSGRTSPTRAKHVTGLNPPPAMVLDGGPCDVGIESSVVDVSGEPPILWRPGNITREAIEKTLGYPLALPEAISGPLHSPGLLASHYAPNAKMRLNVTTAKESEMLLGFGPNAPGDCLNLSPSGDVREAAHNLFDYLRKADQATPHTIAVMPIPESGIGLAINDRLRRAAAPKG